MAGGHAVCAPRSLLRSAPIEGFRERRRASEALQRIVDRERRCTITAWWRDRPSMRNVPSGDESAPQNDGPRHPSVSPS